MTMHLMSHAYDTVRRGRGKVQTRTTHQTFQPLTQPKISSYRRDEGTQYPSADSVQQRSDACSAPERKQYTGDLIAGIATMHKSNAVPVMKGTDEAKDIARMRR